MGIAVSFFQVNKNGFFPESLLQVGPPFQICQTDRDYLREAG